MMASRTGRAAPSALLELRIVQLLQSGVQLFARRGQVLQEFNVPIEMDDESLVLVFAHQVFQKGVAGDALLLQDPPLTHAGVHQQAKGEREIGFLGEVANRLRTAVFLPVSYTHLRAHETDSYLVCR